MPYVRRFKTKRKSLGRNRASAKARKPRVDKEKSYDLWLSSRSLTQLKGELDRVFSLWVRQKDADPHTGMNKCATCGTRMHWRQLQCGHYHSRRHLSIRWDEFNTAPQDKKCNIFNQGAGPEFAQYIIKKHGAQTLDLLIIKKNNSFKAGKFEYICLIKEYIEKLKSINGLIK